MSRYARKARLPVLKVPLRRVLLLARCRAVRALSKVAAGRRKAVQALVKVPMGQGAVARPLGKAPAGLRRVA